MVQDTTLSGVPYYVSDIGFWIKIYALVLSIIGAVKSTKKIIHLWKTRNLRKVWGIKDSENVTVICSELDDPIARQNIEDREFIYNLKYGDVDAYFEVIVTLLRLYPKLKLRLLSAGEAESMKIDSALAQTIVLIGGPDYNSMVERILEKGITQFTYKSPHIFNASSEFPKEIVLHHRHSDKEFCEIDEFKDYGYFERIANPNNPKRKIIIIGGCHTVGVTAAVKAFSLFNNEYDDISSVVLDNSAKVSKQINNKTEFAILVNAERVGQSINTPIVIQDKILIGKK